MFPLQIVLGAERHHPSAEGRFSGKQGEVLWIEVPVNTPQASVNGTLLKRKIPFFPITDTSFAAIVGIDMQDPPGVQELRDHGSDLGPNGSSQLLHRNYKRRICRPTPQIAKE